MNFVLIFVGILSFLTYLSMARHNEVCDEEMAVSGDCADAPRLLWSFNKATNKCESYMGKDCGWNGNRFEYEESCENVCVYY